MSVSIHSEACADPLHLQFTHTHFEQLPGTSSPTSFITKKVELLLLLLSSSSSSNFLSFIPSFWMVTMCIISQVLILGIISLGAAHSHESLSDFLHFSNPQSTSIESRHALLPIATFLDKKMQLMKLIIIWKINSKGRGFLFLRGG